MLLLHVSQIATARPPQDEIIGPQVGNGSFEQIDPSDAPVSSGPRRAAKGRIDFEIPGWTLTNQRGFVGVDGIYSATDGQHYLFANTNSILKLTSGQVKNLDLKFGDGLQLDFQLAGKVTGKVAVKVVYQLGDYRWAVDARDVNLPKVDKYVSQQVTHRLPLDVNDVSVSIIIDTLKQQGQQVRLDNVRLKRIAAASLPPLPTEYFVASDGDDKNPGTLKRPFRTIQKAADLAAPGVTVFLRKGVYQEKVTLRASGAPGRPIVFRPYQQEQVTVSTADRVQGWRKATGDVNGDGQPDSNIWVADVGQDVGGKRECNTVFVDGQLRFEAKHFAEQDPLVFDNWGKIKRGDLSFTQLRSDQLKGGRRNFWAGAKVRHHTTDWSSFDSTIQSSDPSSGTLKFANKLGYLISQKQDLGFYIFDSIKTLDKPGEWFKDRSGKLFYYPVGNEKPNRIRVAFKQRDFTFDVRDHSHVTFDSLILEGGALQMNADNRQIRLVNSKLFGYTKGGLGVFRFQGDHNRLEGNEIYQAFESAAVVSGSFHRIVNNNFHDLSYKVSQRSLPMQGHSHLVSYNTFSKFARNIVSVFPFRSEYSYNLFERGGMISWDTAVFDGDVNSGDGGGCVIHHNVFRNSPTNGAYFAIYSGVDLVFHHNLVFNFGPEHRHHGSAQCMKFYHNTFVGADPQGVRIGSSAPFQSSYCNNIQLKDDRVKSLGVEFRGNFNHGRRDFVDPAKSDFRLARRSKAIDSGILIPGINDDYRGEAPDAGAIEFGEKMWQVGHDFKNPPNIKYVWKTIPGMNLDENGQFEIGAPSNWGKTGNPGLFDGNTWNTLKRGLSPTGGRSYEIEPGEGIHRVFDVKPQTNYQISVDARLVGRRIRLVDFEGSSGSVQKKKHRSEEYVHGLDQGEWVVFKGIDFGADSYRFDQAELLFSRHTRDSSKGDAQSSRLELRVDAPTGPLLGTFKYRASVAEVWYVSVLEELKAITGKHDVYLVAQGKAAGKMYLARLRFLNTKLAQENALTVIAKQDSAPPQVSYVGRPYWTNDYESFGLTTGSADNQLSVTMKNTGDFTAYVDRFALVEVAGAGNVQMSRRASSGGKSDSIGRFVSLPKQPQKLGQLRLGLVRQSGDRDCAVRVRAWTVPSLNDPDAPHDQKRFVYWEKKYRRTFAADNFDLILKGTDPGDKRGVPLNSQPVGMITVELSQGQQWSLDRVDATGDSYTDLVRTDGRVQNSKSTWDCTFTQMINVGEIRAWLPGSRTIPNTQIYLKDDRGRTVWKKKYRKGQKVDWTGCLLIDGSEKSDGGRIRLGSVLAKSIQIVTPQLAECAYRDVEVRDQRVAPPVKNLSLRSRSIQSSDLYGDKGLAPLVNNAVLQPYIDFTSTDEQQNPWLDLILEKPSDIDQIVLYNRASADKRIGDFRVNAIDPQGKTVWFRDYSWKKGDLAAGKSLTIDKRLKNVQKVRIQIKGKSLLHLAEVLIWAK